MPETVMHPRYSAVSAGGLPLAPARVRAHALGTGGFAIEAMRDREISAMLVLGQSAAEELLDDLCAHLIETYRREKAA